MSFAPPSKERTSRSGGSQKTGTANSRRDGAGMPSAREDVSTGSFTSVASAEAAAGGKHSEAEEERGDVRTAAEARRQDNGEQLP